MPRQMRGDRTINQDVESACGMPRKMRGRRRQVRGGRNVPKGKEKK